MRNKIIINKDTAIKAICKMLHIDSKEVNGQNPSYERPFYDIEFDFEKRKNIIILDHFKFEECSICSKKPGLTVLCDSCIINRTVIEDLKRFLNEK